MTTSGKEYGFTHLPLPGFFSAWNYVSRLVAFAFDSITYYAFLAFIFTVSKDILLSRRNDSCSGSGSLVSLSS